MSGDTGPQRSKSPKSKKRATLIPALTATFVFPNGEKYVGEYVNLGHGKIERNGQGTHMFSNGMEYCGAWAKDKMSGSGELKYTTGAAYKGDFVDNEYCGTGTYTWPDGSCFTGTFAENRMDGQGEFMDSKGHMWIGSITGREGIGLRLKYS